MRNKLRQDGFTHLIVVIIIGILTLLSVGVFYYLQAKTRAHQSPIKRVENAAEVTNSPTQTISATLPTLKQGAIFYDTTCGRDTIIWFYDADRISESQLGSVCYVTIEGKNLDQFPKELYNLPNLKNLSFSYNTIPLEPPNDIDRLSELIDLSLNNNGISSIPNSIGNLKHLTYLDLSNNKLSTLPNSIGNLKNLEHLLLSNNQLTTIPPEIGNLTMLKELYLENNKLTSLPERISALKQPLTMYLEGNNFNSAEKQKISHLMPNAIICFANCLYGE